MKMLKPLFLSAVGIMGLTATSASFADDFGCKAVMCFAGGKGLAECQDTIKEVKKRLAKGKGFPHCTFVNDDGSSSPSIVSQSNVWTRKLGKRNNVCPDGTKTSWYKDKNFRCNAISVTFKGVNEDGSNQTQEINW